MQRRRRRRSLASECSMLTYESLETAETNTEKGMKKIKNEEELLIHICTATCNYTNLVFIEWKRTLPVVA